MASPAGIVTLIALATLQGGQPIHAELAWDGAVTGDALTELAVRATTGLDAEVALELATTDTVVAAKLESRSDETASANLPVIVERSGDVHLRFSIADSPWQALDAGRLEHGDGQVVVVGQTATNALAGVAGTTVVDPQDLPTLPSTYTHVAALVIDEDALARIDEPRLRALLEHAGLCGRLLLVDPPVRVERLIRQSAACGGLHVVATSGDDATRALRSLTSSRVGALPDARALGKLIDGRETRIRLLAIYLGGFLLVFGLLSLVPRLRVAAMAFSVLTTALAGLLWDDDYRGTFVAWGEMATGDGVARYSGLERAAATGRGDQVVRLQSLALSPISIAGKSLVLRWSEVPGDRQVEWSTALLQEMQVLSMGSFHAESRLRASAGDDALVVCNQSGGTARAAYLRWQGDNYAVPALKPGERWVTDDRNVTDEISPHLGLLARRAADTEPTFLFPLDIPGNGRDQQAWLMAVEVASEDAPCSG